MASPVFERMFFGGYNKETKEGVVCLHNVSVDAVKWTLDNLYSGNTSLENVKMALDVYNFCQMYQITGLVELCKQVRGQCNVVKFPNVVSIARYEYLFPIFGIYI